jgi:UDP-hydrolysing UDP-N-acetyl-D-glucosamine 2-epimerase
VTRASRRAIGVVTVSRSDYGHLVPVLQEIQAAPDLELLLFVGGMHLEPVFGSTVDAIEADGWRITERIQMLEPEDSAEAIAVAIGKGVAGFARAFGRHRPELLLVLGDRFEMLAAATAALPLTIPVAHIHGGEESLGAIDNQVRHAITKLAHLHFASTEGHATRITQMGEESWRIHVVGAPGLDRIRTTRLLSREGLAEALDLPIEPPWFLITFHPVTLEYADTAAHLDELLGALEKLEGTLIVTYPNADTAGRTIIQRLQEFAARSPRTRLIRNLGDQKYLSLLEHADAMIGNSSSGLIEAPSFGLPVVNIGNRQGRRARGANVIDVECVSGEILKGIDAALTPGLRGRLREMPNPFGDGRTAPRIVKVLREVSPGAALVEKRFH